MGRRLLMYFGVITLFPEMIDAVTKFGVTRRACENGLIKVDCINPRDYTEDKFGNVDDKPYGGGPGMLMQVQPLRDALRVARSQAPKDTKVVCMSPQGVQLNHSLVTDIHSWGSVILIAGRYEGIDERVLQIAAAPLHELVMLLLDTEEDIENGQKQREGENIEQCGQHVHQERRSYVFLVRGEILAHHLEEFAHFFVVLSNCSDKSEESDG